MGVIRNVAVEVGLTGFAWGELDHVDVVFDERDAAAEVEELLPAVEGLGVEAAGVDEDIEPLVGGELGAFLEVLA